jgi:hypothetical protein
MDDMETWRKSMDGLFKIWGENGRERKLKIDYVQVHGSISKTKSILEGGKIWDQIKSMGFSKENLWTNSWRIRIRGIERRIFHRFCYIWDS